MALLEVREAIQCLQGHRHRIPATPLPCFAGVNSAGEITSETTADSSTWEGPVLVQQSDRIPVSAFAEQLQYEPEQEPERQS